MDINKDITKNLEYMKERMSYGLSSDVIIKNFTINGGVGRRLNCFIIFIEGTVNSEQIDRFIVEPLQIMPRGKLLGNLEDVVEKQLITIDQLSKASDYDAVVKSINYGGCGIFIDSLDVAFTADVKGWKLRGADSPENETVVRGPQLGFNESLRGNTGLIRKIIRNENLICKSCEVGKSSITGVNVVYMKNIADKQLVDEVLRRLNNIKADNVFDSGELELLIEDFTFLPTPQILSTERPDRVASAITKGKIALIVDGSPFALVLPINVFELTHSQEDNYLRTPYANLIRIMRLIAMVSALLLPGIFIAMVNFHHESIPVHLLFAIASSREKVPFSLLTELIILEFAFEFIREASIRMPGTGGNAIGIIGGLIVGQAAVEANLVSPISIIIVALTGIGSFVIPNYSLGLSFRVVKYLYIILGALGGFLGITLGMFLQLIWLCSAQSFGIPFFAPLAPKYQDNSGTFFVKPIWKRNGQQSFVPAKKKSIFPSRMWASGTDETLFQPDDTNIIE